MDIRLTEDQQIEELKKIWKEYGRYVLMAVVIVAIGSFAWRHWQQHQDNIRGQASMAYEQLLTSVVNNDNDAVKVEGEHLKTDFADTTYASLAALFLARQEMYDNHLDAATEELQWVQAHAKIPALREIARLREARILLEERQPEKAIDLLNTAQDKTFAPLVEELRGDCYVALGRKNEARDAYKMAYDAEPNAILARPLLRMKLENLNINSITKPNANALGSDRDLGVAKRNDYAVNSDRPSQQING